MEEKSEKNIKLEKILTFLKRTKEGSYSPIETSSLKFIRMKQQTETYLDEDEYYYSVT